MRYRSTIAFGTRGWTYDHIEETMVSRFLALPETQSARELMDGAVQQKPATNGVHGLLMGAMAEALRLAARANKPAIQLSSNTRSLMSDAKSQISSIL